MEFVIRISSETITWFPTKAYPESQCDVKLNDGSVEKVTFVVDWNFVVLGAELINSDY